MIVDRYLTRETATPFCLIVLFLVGVFVAYSLTRFLTEANAGLLSVSAIMALTGLKAIIALEVLLPIALYIGLILALGRLYSDWEVIALKASGISENRIIAPVLTMAAAVAATVAILSLWVRPWAYDLLYRFEADAKATVELEALAPGQFHIHGSGERTVFLDARSEADELGGIFIRSRNAGVLEVISAGSGRLTSFAREDAHLLEMQRAFVYKQTADGETLVGRFAALDIWAPALKPEPLDYKPKAAPTALLLASNRDEDRSEVQWRASTACSTLLLALAAVPLSRTRPRRGRYARVLLAVLIYAFYYNFIGVARSEVEQGEWAHIWWVPGGLGAGVGAAWLALRRVAP